MSKDLSLFLKVIDAISKHLEAPQRNQDKKAADCTVRQLAALGAVNKNGRINMSSLAVDIDVPVSTATRIVDQLVSKGLLVRHPSSQDARKVEVDFSAYGGEINAHITQSREAHASSMLSAFSEKERATFLNLLSKLQTEPC